jgi:uncharacterized protein
MPTKEVIPISEKELLTFLLNTDSYPHRPKHVHIKQTHSSYILLAAPYVYKIKKSVNFGFLDFSTLEKRRYFSEREIELNRRLCPDVHLGVVPISLGAGGLTFGPGDVIVEYTVKMRKLEDRYFFLQLLKRKQIGTDQLDRIVLVLKAFYEAQKPSEEISAWGRVEKLKISTDENFRQTEAFIGFTISEPAFETIQFYTNRFYARNAGLFESRISGQRIRDCHGDLHLEHIHLAPNELSIYDCIEFNDRFRYIDIANDVAFLAMDLDHHGHPDLSKQFIGRIAKALRDPQMLRLMDFYKCYRAYVRGKAESFYQSASGTPEQERRQSRIRGEGYFRLALQYAVCGSQPSVVVVMGRAASGKSTLARCLGRELGWEVFSSDETRKALAGVPVYKRCGPAVRSRLYSPGMTKLTYDALFSNAINRVQEQRGVIVDATFSSREHRDELRRQLGVLGMAYFFIETRASEETLKRRLMAREVKLDGASDARLEDFEALTRSYAAPAEIGSTYLIGLHTERPLQTAVVRILKTLSQRIPREEI